MFVRVQAHEMKPLMNCVAANDLISGAPVAYDAKERSLGTAHRATEYIVVSGDTFNFMGAVIEPTDAMNERIPEGKLCLRYTPEVGDIFATTEFNLDGAELMGCELAVSGGKFIAGNSGSIFVCLGHYDNPWGLDMIMVERRAEAYSASNPT